MIRRGEGAGRFDEHNLTPLEKLMHFPGTPQEPKAQKCPVCEGSGYVKTQTFISTGADMEPILHMSEEKSCHGCDGKGWVTV